MSLSKVLAAILNPKNILQIGVSGVGGHFEYYGHPRLTPFTTSFTYNLLSLSVNDVFVLNEATFGAELSSKTSSTDKESKLHAKLSQNQ